VGIDPHARGTADRVPEGSCSRHSTRAARRLASYRGTNAYPRSVQWITFMPLLQR
jgi:hypothetical protein